MQFLLIQIGQTKVFLIIHTARTQRVNPIGVLTGATRMEVTSSPLWTQTAGLCEGKNTDAASLTLINLIFT